MWRWLVKRDPPLVIEKERGICHVRFDSDSFALELNCGVWRLSAKGKCVQNAFVYTELVDAAIYALRHVAKNVSVCLPA